MRDIDRIDPFMKELAEIWKNNVPDWRFGQFVYNIISVCGDPFFWEEDTFLEKVREMMKKRH